MANPVPIYEWDSPQKFVQERVLPYRDKVWGCAVHHVYSALRNFRGISSIREVQDDWHIAGRGWSAGGANAYTGAGGELYNMRPLSWHNWCHAIIEGKALSDLPSIIRQQFARDSNFFNHHVFGCEMWGNYDVEDPWTSPAVEACVNLFAEICKVCELDPYERIWPHGQPRATAKERWGPGVKSCPGHRVDLDRFIDEVARAMDYPTPAGVRAFVMDPAVQYGRELRAQIIDNEVWVPFREAYQDALDFRVNGELLNSTGKVFAAATPDSRAVIERMTGDRLSGYDTEEEATP